LLTTLDKDAKLLLAKKDGKAIAGILLTFAGDTATYYYGASDHEFRSLMAPYLLQWRGIQFAKRRRCRFYDFLGIAQVLDSRGTEIGNRNQELWIRKQGADFQSPKPKAQSPNHRLAGVSSFKLKFGGEVVQYPMPRVLILKPFIYWVFWLVKKFRI
jgi:lipid II:glycine glycyltransferase (peptidoglycan interpeptide bridge formation enzyme)